MNNFFELSFELEKIRAIVNCLDDAITNAVTYSPSEAGNQALCLVDLLQERMDALIDSAANLEGGAA